MSVSNEEKVNHLDTASFNDTIHTYERHIQQFEDIVRSVAQVNGQVLAHWKGVGRDAFEKDCTQVRINLKDVTDIMYDLRDALINAHAEYMKTDNSLSKSFES